MKNLFGQVIKLDVPEDGVDKSNAPKLFDWLRSINQTKIDLRNKDKLLSSFDPFIINKGIGQSQDTLGFANFINKMPNLPKDMVYLFYLHGIPKNRSYSKWSKATHGKDLKPFMLATGLSKQKALDALKVLTKEQIKRVLRPIGGKVKN
jgi:hypothetical protein